MRNYGWQYILNEYRYQKKAFTTVQLSLFSIPTNAPLTFDPYN